MKKPVIIIEGPDGTGKTTLCNYLVKKHGYRYFHEGPPPAEGDMIEFYAAKLWRALQSRNPVVYDRFHLGEMVYGPIARHVDRLGYYGMRMFLRIFKSQPVHCAVATPPWDNCRINWLKNMATGNDYLGNFTKMEDSYHKFVGLSAYHGRFDYTQDDPENWYGVAVQINNNIKKIFPAGFIGHNQAKFLILGERTNATVSDFPFINSGNSSRFLNDALWEAGFQEEEMAFGNTFNRRGTRHDLTKIVKMLPNLKVVLAFGDNAKESCEYHGLRHVHLMHPACFFRFHQRRRPVFVKNLKDVRDTHVQC